MINLPPLQRIDGGYTSRNVNFRELFAGLLLRSCCFAFGKTVIDLSFHWNHGWSGLCYVPSIIYAEVNIHHGLNTSLYLKGGCTEGWLCLKLLNTSLRLSLLFLCSIGCGILSAHLISLIHAIVHWSLHLYYPHCNHCFNTCNPLAHIPIWAIADFVWDTSPPLLPQTTFTSLLTSLIHAASIQVQRLLQPTSSNHF